MAVPRLTLPGVVGRFAVLSLLLSFALAGCAVHWVSDYDEVLDRTATETQQKITLLLTQVQNPSSPARQYANSARTYEEILSDLHAMRTRAEANNAQGENAETIVQIGKIEENVALVEEEHRRKPSGPSPDFAALAQRTIDVQFHALIQFELAKKRGEGG
jgi:hypothetical protein